MLRVAQSSAGESVAAAPGVLRTTLAVGEQSMLVRIDLAAGAEIPLHAHVYEQTGFLVSGDLALVTDGRSWSVGPGDAWSIPGEVPHGARSHGGASVVEVFTPLRADYLPGPEPAPPDAGDR